MRHPRATAAQPVRIRRFCSRAAGTRRSSWFDSFRKNSDSSQLAYLVAILQTPVGDERAPARILPDLALCLERAADLLIVAEECPHVFRLLGSRPNATSDPQLLARVRRSQARQPPGCSAERSLQEAQLVIQSDPQGARPFGIDIRHAMVRFRRYHRVSDGRRRGTHKQMRTVAPANKIDHLVLDRTELRCWRE